MDKITLDRIKLLHPKLRDEALEIYTEICERLTGKAFCRFSYTLRTFAEQNALYAQGRTTPGAIVTYARGGQSFHNFGLAFDWVLCVDNDGDGKYESASWDIKKDFDGDGQSDFEEINFVCKMHGWNGLYKADGTRWDYPHFQKTFGLNEVECLKRYNNKQVDKEGYIII